MSYQLDEAFNNLDRLKERLEDEPDNTELRNAIQRAEARIIALSREQANESNLRGRIEQQETLIEQHRSAALIGQGSTAEILRWRQARRKLAEMKRELESPGSNDTSTADELKVQLQDAQAERDQYAQRSLANQNPGDHIRARQARRRANKIKQQLAAMEASNDE